MTVTFVGDKDIAHTQQIKEQLENTVVGFIGEGATDFFLGVMGFNFLAAVTVKQLKKQ